MRTTKQVSAKKLRKAARKWKHVDWSADDSFAGCLMRSGEGEAGDRKVLSLESQKSKPRSNYKLVEAVVDSGCEESVTDPERFPGAMTPSAMSAAGKGYKGADNNPTPNLGQKGVKFQTDEGYSCSLPFQCARVAHPLLSVTQLAEGGNDVFLHKAGGSIVNKKTGRKTSLVRKGGLYILRMWVKQPEASVFAGPKK